MERSESRDGEAEDRRHGLHLKKFSAFGEDMARRAVKCFLDFCAVLIARNSWRELCRAGLSFEHAEVLYM